MSKNQQPKATKTYRPIIAKNQDLDRKRLQMRQRLEEEKKFGQTGIINWNQEWDEENRTWKLVGSKERENSL